MAGMSSFDEFQSLWLKIAPWVSQNLENRTIYEYCTSTYNYLVQWRTCFFFNTSSGFKPNSRWVPWARLGFQTTCIRYENPTGYLVPRKTMFPELVEGEINHGKPMEDPISL